MKKGRLITLLGPTASGKTALGIHLAKQFKSCVISGDAFQVYRGFNIGTAKVTLQEADGVPHYLIDCLDGEESYSAAKFCEMADFYIQNENREGRIPILVGGTGLYVQSLLEGYKFLPKGSGRDKWERLYEEEGKEGLISYFRSQYPGETIPSDPQRLIRRLEVLDTESKKLYAEKSKTLVYEGPVIGLYMDRKDLYDRINMRVHDMMRAGLEEEVRRLLDSGVPETAQPWKGIGYKEMLPVLRGDMTLVEGEALIQKNTRHFAKRQMTWYRRMPYIHWTEQAKKPKDVWYRETEDYIRSYFRGEMQNGR